MCVCPTIPGSAYFLPLPSTTYGAAELSWMASVLALSSTWYRTWIIPPPEVTSTPVNRTPYFCSMAGLVGIAGWLPATPLFVAGFFEWALMVRTSSTPPKTATGRERQAPGEGGSRPHAAARASVPRVDQPPGPRAQRWGSASGRRHHDP